MAFSIGIHFETYFCIFSLSYLRVAGGGVGSCFQQQFVDWEDLISPVGRFGRKILGILVILNGILWGLIWNSLVVYSMLSSWLK